MTFLHNTTYMVNPFVPFIPLGGWEYRPTFGPQYPESGRSQPCLYANVFKEYSISFLMVCRLIEVVLKLLMFKVCGIIVISKIKFFNFTGNERVNLFLVSLESLVMFDILYELIKTLHEKMPFKCANIKFGIVNIT